MSDKNRNMNDIDDQKMIDRTEQAALDQTAEQQAFSEEIRRRLAAPDSGKPTLEEFKLLVYKDREKRRKKRNALVACIVAAFIVGYLTYDDLVPEVGADKNPKKTIQTEDGVIIEDGGYGSSVGEENVWVTEDWEQVEDAQNIFPRMAVLHYVPEGYIFTSLVIRQNEVGSYVSKYLFKDIEKNTLEIDVYQFDDRETSIDINNVVRKIELKKGDIYIQDENKKATVHFEDGIAVIWPSLSDEDLVKIANELFN